jgi:hypothetical protein
MGLSAFDAAERIAAGREVAGKSTPVPTLIPPIEATRGINLWTFWVSHGINPQIDLNPFAH